MQELWLERCADPTLAESIEVQHLHDISGDHPQVTVESVTETTVQPVDSVGLSQNSGDILMCAHNQDGGTASLQNSENLSEISEAANHGYVGLTPYGTQTSHKRNKSLLHRTNGNSHIQTNCGYYNCEILAADVCNPSDRDYEQCSYVSPQHSSFSQVGINSSVNRLQDSASVCVNQNENTCQHCPLCRHLHICQQRSQTSSDGEIAFLVDSILELLMSRMSTVLESQQELLQKLIVLMEFFRHEFLMTDPSGETAAFPYVVLEQYTLLIKNHAVQTLFENSFDIPCRRNAVLCLLSEWLGQQLCSLSDALHCKVEDFKQRNINCIENLPCPRTLVDLVFPRCMQVLLVHWLGQGEEEETEGLHGASDHSYSTLAVKRPDVATPVCTPSSDKFPFIQFILEFANNALISGVAHVVYSRLVNSC